MRQPETCILIRWTVLMPTRCNAAVFRTLTPVERAPDRGGYPLLNWRPVEPLSLRPSPRKSRRVSARGSSPPRIPQRRPTLEESPARWGRGIECLLVYEDVDPGGLQFAQKGDEVL